VPIKVGQDLVAAIPFWNYKPVIVAALQTASPRRGHLSLSAMKQSPVSR